MTTPSKRAIPGAPRAFSCERGMALILAIAAILLITLLGLALTSSGILSVSLTTNKQDGTQAFYFADTGVLEALRYNKWKMHFRLSPENIWDRGPELKVFPQLINLRSDPFEEGIGAMAYKDWMFKHVFTLVPAQAIVGRFLKTLAEYPPRQKAADFGLDRVMEQLHEAKQN